MSALAQKTYQSYFGPNEWSNASMRDQFDNDIEEPDDYPSIQDCNDAGDLVLFGTQREFLAADGAISIANGSFYDVPLVHHNVKFAHAIYWVAIKKSLQRLVVGSATRTEDIAVKFSVLVELWRKDTEFSSSSTSIVEHAAYREIVSWGDRAVPLILRDLELNGGHWFNALQELTGVNPVDASDAGRVRKMREAWLNWGRENKLI
jgi:hypothetical protein